MDLQSVHEVELVQAWQLFIAEEHSTQTEAAFRYCVAVQAVQEVPFNPLAHTMQKEELVQELHPEIAELQDKH